MGGFLIWNVFENCMFISFRLCSEVRDCSFNCDNLNFSDIVLQIL
jgi:hypothetical protein